MTGLVIDHPTPYMDDDGLVLVKDFTITLVASDGSHDCPVFRCWLYRKIRIP